MVDGVDAKAGGEGKAGVAPDGAGVTPDGAALWQIHGEWYDLRQFARVHPGGSTAILLAQGSDATDLFEQFHLFNDRHRAALRGLRAVSPGAKQAAPAWSAFHADLKILVREHFAGPRRFAHKAKPAHVLLMTAIVAAYAACFVQWWRGSVLVGGLLLPLCAWFVMANMSHDGSHHAVSGSPFVNEVWLAAASPLLYSYASWYMQHCVSHHRHTNDVDEDVDVSHHPFARWHRLTKVDHKYLNGAINLVWHFTAFLLSTINMSVVHPWKFVVVPLWLRWRHGNAGLPEIFGADNAEFAAAEAAQGREAPHELKFFRVAGEVHRNGLFFDAPRACAALATWLAGVAFLVLPFYRFGAWHALCLTLLPYAVTSVIFFAVTQISHVQAACQRAGAPPQDFFQRQTTTSLDYAVDSQLWRFLTGGLNLQSIHHVMPGVHSSHYTDLYPKFYALCVKHGCAPANLPTFTDACAAHLRHIYALGDLRPKAE
mmetsp:Transcript_28022/g.96423  ORF Transcript_28022/g.96423 Transcript_28022/m.96423 type:complete len:485 (-) Transcript_28022:20-1474(-)